MKNLISHYLAPRASSSSRRHRIGLIAPAIALSIAALAVAPPVARAAAPAFDSASDIQYGPTDPTPPVGVAPTFWDPTGLDNGGAGLGPFLGGVVGAGGGGFFMASSVGNGNGLDDGVAGGVPGDGDIDTINAFIPGAVAWGMFSGAATTVEMVRPLSGPMTIGETISIDFDNGFIGPGGAVGITLQTGVGLGLGAGATAFEFLFFGGAGSYSVTDGTGTFFTGLPFTDEGMTLSLTVTGPGTYAATVTFKGGAPVGGAGPLAGGGGPIVQARIFSFSNPGGPAFDTYANNISVVPEPSTYVLMALGILGLLVWRRKKSTTV